LTLFKLKRVADLQGKPRDITELFEEVVDLYNSSQHSSTQFTPLELHRPVLQTPEKATSVTEVLFEQRLQFATLYAIAKQNIEASAAKSDKVHRKKNKNKLRVFAEGDEVYYKVLKELRKKGQLLYDCVAQISKVHRNNRYTLKFISTAPPNADRTFHANEIKKRVGKLLSSK